MGRGLVALGLLGWGVAHADVPDLITDRPDFTESSAAVPPRWVQAELGAQLTLSDAVRELAAPALLLRVGVIRNVELRVGAPSAVVTWADGERDTTPGALELGAKLVLPGEGGAAGVLPYVSLPVRAGDHESVGVAAGIKGVWSVDLADNLGLGGNVGMELAGLSGDADVTWNGLGSLSLGLGLTERLGSFVELFWLFDRHTLQAFAQTGLTFSVLARLQLDVHGALMLEAPASGHIGAGAAIIF